MSPYPDAHQSSLSHGEWILAMKMEFLKEMKVYPCDIQSVEALWFSIGTASQCNLYFLHKHDTTGGGGVYQLAVTHSNIGYQWMWTVCKQ